MTFVLRALALGLFLVATWGYVSPKLPQAQSGDITGYLVSRRVGLRAPVRRGDSETILRKGLGWIPGSRAIAGHRDTYFRPIRLLQAGDEIVFESSIRREVYKVTRTEVVDPANVSVLDNLATITLITCYPFDFVGHAPRRFVVHTEPAATFTLRTSDLL